MPFYNKNDGLKITDLHQGIVWGTQTQNPKDERLINRFDYDGDYGTVLNRFLMQSAVGHPMTVHGTGGQTRAFIHIQDTVKCIQLAVENPPQHGERVQILNQMTETHRVRDLAKLIADKPVPKSLTSTIRAMKPRKMISMLKNQRLLGLGLDPITLEAGLLDEVTEIARKYADRCDLSKFRASPIGPTTRRVRKAELARKYFASRSLASVRTGSFLQKQNRAKFREISS